MISGIYMIVNKINFKIYIGQSNNVTKRLIGHKSDLKCNTHSNSYLQRSVGAHGIENFDFKLIEECSQEIIDDRERFWISEFNSTNEDFGYNLESGGKLLKTHSEESKLKNRLAHIGKPSANKGKTFSDEYRKKLSDAHKGKKQSEETKRKRSDAMTGEKHPFYGKKLSAEHLKNLSESHKGNIPTNKIEATQEMIDDVKNGITQFDFKIKYNKGIWSRLKKELGIEKLEKPYNYIEVTSEMIEDVRNGISKRKFTDKYKYSDSVWKRIKKELKDAI